MKNKDLPKNEDLRLAELKSFCILNTPAEALYDDVTRMAALFCDTPVSLISLVDENRQWFKSKVGISAQETPRDISFCSHAIKNAGIFVVSNAETDERFSSNPLVQNAPFIKFYAGVPLVTSQNLAVGTLCVVDTKPRVLTTEQLEILKALARQVVNNLEYRKTNLALKEKVLEIESQQKKMLHNSKMAALGEMAGGVAHEINNPIAIMSGYSQMLRSAVLQKTLSNEIALNTLDKIDLTIARIIKVVRGLREFSRNGDKDEFQESFVKLIVEDTLELCVARYRNEGITLRFNEVPADLSFDCRAVQVSQVLLNLLNNAADAVKEKKEKWVEVSCQDLGKVIHFKVRDSGDGIPGHLRQKIMQPFFSTKEPGKGSGLGLSISMGLIGDHGGRLYLDEQDPNTCFVMEIPKKHSAIKKSA